MANDSCDVFGGSIVKPNNTESLNTLEISELYAFAIVHLTICLIGIFGNILSLSVLKRNRFLQTVPNAYIAHLAATDLCVCFTIPVQVTQLFFGTESNSTWDTFPDELCVIIGHILVIMNSSTLIAMMMIAINRYILILKGRTLYNKIYTKRNTTISIIISWCWVLAFTTAIPQAANLSSFGYNYKFGVCIFKSYCFKSYVYAGIFLTIPIFLPVTIATGVSYTLIIRKLIRVRRKIYRTNPQKPNLRLNRKAGDGDTALDNIDSGVEVSHYDSPQKEQANDQESDTESEMDFVDNDEDEEQVKTVNAITKSSEQQTQSIAVKRTAGASNIQHQTSEDRGLMASTEEANQMESSFQTQPKEKLHKASSSPVEESPASPTPFVRSKSFIRRLSPAKIRIRSATFVARLRRPKWKKHCLAIVNMITIYLVMWICWLPIILLYSIDWQGKVSAVGYKVTVTLMYLNSSFNVLLYAMMNNSHRKALILQLSRTCKCK